MRISAPLCLVGVALVVAAALWHYYTATSWTRDGRDQARRHPCRRPGGGAADGYRRPVVGHVASFTLGISNANATPSTQGLPSVNPVYSWVRLAQRIPVRIHIDTVPPGVVLVAGMTATVEVVSGQ